MVSEGGVDWVSVGIPLNGNPTASGVGDPLAPRIDLPSVRQIAYELTVSVRRQLA